MTLGPSPREALETYSEYEAYISAIDNFEEIITDDNIYPVVENKRCCYTILEVIKLGINFLERNINATEKSSNSKDKDE